jgi:phosphoserine aminotransferase
MAEGRSFNFSAGPAAVPLECLEQAARDLPNWNSVGCSVIELSHRSSPWSREMADTTNRIRRLLNIPGEFSILLLSGGASLQFSAVPFNLIGNATKVDYLVTGNWSQKAYEECKRLAFPGVEVRSVGPLPVPANPTNVPDPSSWDPAPDAAYCYMCVNETIQGIQFRELPNVPTPLVIDASSEFLSRPITEWEKIGALFACAQKNFGVAGFTVAVIRTSLLERPLKPLCPVTLDWRVQLKNKCLYNTPPTFAIYFGNLVFKWIEAKGGVEAIEKTNRAKAAKLYQAIDESPYFENRVEVEARSVMNVPFFRKGGYEVRDNAIDQVFLDFCTSRNLASLGGHQAVGGFRASIYNALPEEGVDALVTAIKEFGGFPATPT